MNPLLFGKVYKNGTFLKELKLYAESSTRLSHWFCWTLFMQDSFVSWMRLFLDKKKTHPDHDTFVREVVPSPNGNGITLLKKGQGQVS